MAASQIWLCGKHNRISFKQIFPDPDNVSVATPYAFDGDLDDDADSARQRA